MNYILITISFFKTYWPEVRRCVSLTVELWTELMKLAPKLANELRQAGAVQAGEPGRNITQDDC